MFTSSWWNRTLQEYGRRQRKLQRRRRRELITPYLATTWLEDRQVLNGVPLMVLEPQPVQVDAGAAADDGLPDLFEASVVGMPGQEHLQVTVNGQSVYNGALGSADRLTIRGSSDQDALVVRGSSSHPAAWDGLAFQAGAGDDRLELQGWSADTVVHSLTAPGTGHVEIGAAGGRSGIAYSGAEAIGDQIASQLRSFRFLSDPGSVLLADDGVAGNSLSRLSWGEGAELTFAAPGERLELQTAAGSAAEIRLLGLDSQFTADLHISGSSESLVRLEGQLALGSGDLRVQAGEISATGTVSTSAGVIDLDAGGSIELSSQATFQNGGGIVRIAGGSVQHDGSIAARGGQVELHARAGTLTVSGSIDVSDATFGGTGGSVQLLGTHVGLFDAARIDAGGDTGGGSVLIGGDFQGANPDVPNALRTFVGSGVQITADALTRGQAGRVIVWADEGTWYYGQITARGGSLAGDGGFVEVSGRQMLDFQGRVALAARASTGSGGTLLLDPDRLRIVNGGTKTNLEGIPTDNDPATYAFSEDPALDATMDAEVINAILRDGTTVTLQATDELIVDEVINGTGGVAGGGLVLQALNDVLIRANITTADGGISIQAGPDATDDVLMTAGVTVDSGAGSIDITAGGMMELAAVNSQGTVTLATSTTAAGAGIFAVANNPAAEVTAETLIVSGTKAVGTIAGALDVDASTIALSNVAGDIHLDAVGTGGVTISASTSQTGNIRISSTSEGLVLDNVATHDGSILILADQSLVARNVDSSHTAGATNSIRLVAPLIELGTVNAGELGNLAVNAGDRITDADGDSSLSGNVIGLGAEHAVGTIDDFGSAAGDPIRITAANQVNAAVGGADAQVFLRYAAASFDPSRIEIDLGVGVAASGLLSVAGDLDASGGIAGLFVVTAGDRVGLATDQTLILPDAGINMGAADLYLHGGIDVRDSDRSLGPLVANALYFSSGAAGGSTTLNTSVAGLTASVAAGDLMVIEANGLTALDLDAGAGQITLQVTEGAVADADADVDITADRITVTLADSNDSGDDFGTLANPIDTSANSLSVDTSAGTAHGSQWIREPDGLAGLNLNAGTGSVRLVLADGSLADADPDTDITAGAAEVLLEDADASGDAVGSLANPLGTSVNSLSVNTAAGGGSQWLEETDGLAAVNLAAGSGDVTLLLRDGALTDGDAGVDIAANSAVVTLADADDSGDDVGTAAAAIGTSVNSLTLQTAAGSLHGNQWVREANGLTALNLNAGAGDVTLIVTEGAVTDPDANVDIVANAATIMLNDANDSGDDLGTATAAIGTSVNGLIVHTEAGGVHGSQWLREADGLTALNLNAGTGDLTLVLVTGSVADPDTNVDITADAAEITLLGGGDFGAETGLIGTSVRSLAVATAGTSVQGSQWIREENGLAGLNLNAGTGDVTLVLVTGSVTDADANADITADAAVVTLVGGGDFGAPSSRIGTAVNSLAVATAGTSVQGSQWIEETDGLTAVNLNAGTGDVALRLAAGSVTDSDTNLDIRADAADITLVGGGGFGASSSRIGTAVNSLAVATAGPSAQGSQWIEEADGLTAVNLNAGGGDVQLHLLTGSLQDVDTDVDIAASAAVVRLAGGDDFGAAGAAIGTSVNSLSVHTAAAGAHGSQWIREANGLTALNLNAGTGDVTLMVAEGSVADLDLDVDIAADRAVVTLSDANDSGDSFGTAVNPIDTSVRSLSVDTAAGSVHGNQGIREADGLSDLNLNAGTGSLTLILLEGALTDADAEVDIAANAAGVTLADADDSGDNFGTALAAIGTSVNSLSVDTAAGGLHGSQWIREANALTALNLNAGTADVMLSLAEGAVTDADAQVDITANAAVITLLDADDSGDNFGSAAAAIGTRVNSLSVATAAGTVHGNQWIGEADGLTALDLNAGAAQVILTLTEGALTDGDADLDLTAGFAQVTLLDMDDSGDNLGGSGSPIQTSVDSLTVSTERGNLDGSQWIREANGLAGLHLNAGTGVVTLVLTEGAVTDTDGSLDITAGVATITLEDADDSGDGFGTAASLIDTLVNSLSVDTAGGHVHGNQWIRQAGGLTALELNAGTGRVTLVVTEGAVTDADAALDITASDAVVTLADANDSGDDFGAAAAPIQTAVDSLTVATAAGGERGSQWIRQARELTALDLNAGTGRVVLVLSEGAVTDADADVDITAGIAEVILADADDSGDEFGTAAQAIGTTVDSLSVNTALGGVHGSQWIEETNGLTALNLNAGQGDVSLVLAEGGVADGDAENDITADVAIVTLADANDNGDNFGTSTGLIGTRVNDLKVDTAAGSAHGSQWIREADGLTALNLNAGTGNVTLVLSDGALTDDDAAVDITATVATIALQDADDSGDAVGTATHRIRVQVSQLSVETTAGDHDGDQWLRVEGSLAGLDLDAGSADVDLIASGSIQDNDGQRDVRARNLTLSATSHIGFIGTLEDFLASDLNTVRGNPIQLDVVTIRKLITTEPDSQIHVAQSGGLVIGGPGSVIDAGGANTGWVIVRATGDIDARAHGSAQLAGGDSLGLFSGATLTVPDAGYETAGHLRMIGQQDVVSASGGDLLFKADSLFLLSGGGGGNADVDSAVKTITAEMLTNNLVVWDTGDLEIRWINVHAGSVYIETTGSINDANDDAVVDIAARDTITLIAGDEIGGLPTAGRAQDAAGRLELAAGSVVAASSGGTGGIVLQGAGSLTLQQLHATSGPVDVTADGDVLVGHIDSASTVTLNADVASILDAVADADADIRAGDLITLLAGVQIGAPGAGNSSLSYLDLDAGSRVVAWATGGGIWLRGVGGLHLVELDATSGPVVVVAAAGDVLVGLVASGDTASIFARSGSILDDSDDVVVDVISGGLITLAASGDIGSLGPNDRYLDLAAGSNVDAWSTTLGAIRLRGEGHLMLTRAATYDGSIEVVADGQLSAVVVTSRTDLEQNDIRLTTTAGDIVVAHVVAGRLGDVFLESAQGIFGSGSNTPEVVADHLQLIATSGVATWPGRASQTWLSIDANTVAADTDWGDVNLLDMGGDLTTLDISISEARALDGVHVIVDNRLGVPDPTAGNLLVNGHIQLTGSDPEGIGDIVLQAAGNLVVGANLEIDNSTDSPGPGDPFLNNLAERGEIRGSAGREVSLRDGVVMSTSRGTAHRALGQISTLAPPITLPTTVYLYGEGGRLVGDIEGLRITDPLGLNYRVHVDWVLGTDPQLTYLARADVPPGAPVQQLVGVESWPLAAADSYRLVDANVDYHLRRTYDERDFAAERPDKRNADDPVSALFTFSFDLRPEEDGFASGIQFQQAGVARPVTIVVQRTVEMQPVAVGLHLPLPEREEVVRVDVRPPDERPTIESYTAETSPAELFMPLSGVVVTARDHLELRRVTARGKEVLVQRWSDGDASALDDLPGLFSQLGNDHYRLYLVRETQEVPLHPGAGVLIRKGVPLPIRASDAGPAAPSDQPGAVAPAVGDALPDTTAPQQAGPAPDEASESSRPPTTGGAGPEAEEAASVYPVSGALVPAAGAALLLSTRRGAWEQRVDTAMKQCGGRSLGRLARICRRRREG